MKTINNSILITGGSAGIGLEIAKIFLVAGNKVIITGRDKTPLDNALKQLPDLNGIAPSVVTRDLFDATAADNYEIRMANTQYIYDLYLKSPDEALALMNQPTLV